MDTILVHAIPNKTCHSDAAMLDLGMPQKADGRLIGLAPELTLGKLQRVIITDNRIKLCRLCLEIVQGLHASISTICS
jgi:hypothetical protein